MPSAYALLLTTIAKGIVSMTGPSIAGVHHIKLPVTDLRRSQHWYESVLGLRIQSEFHDADGSVGGVAGTITDVHGTTVIAVALRHNPEAATGISGFDPLALSLPDHAALQTWAEHVIALGLPAPATSPDGTVLFLHDPDGLEIRLFSPEH